MYNKTTSTFFNEFGSITRREDFQSGYTYTVKNQELSQMYVLTEDLIVSVSSGIVLVSCSYSKTEQPAAFALHSEIKINKGVLFNFVAITKDATLTTSCDLSKLTPAVQLNEVIHYEKIKPKIQVEEIYSYYHQTKSPNYVFSGETHSYWELTYVDSGTLETTIGDKTYRLEAFDLILSAPHQFHSQKVLSRQPCTYLTVIFELNHTYFPTLMNKVFHYNYQIRDILNEFIRFTNNETFDPDWSNSICATLTSLIAKLDIFDLEHGKKRVNKTPQHRNYEIKMLAEITKYMSENIYSAIMIDDICRQFGISRTTLQNLFHSELNISPKLYINNLRLDVAKTLLRERKFNVSEISSSLGFSSIQYFSKKFRQRFKISPREYAKSNYN